MKRSLIDCAFASLGSFCLKELGVTPKEGLTGNAWKQSAMATWHLLP